MQRGNLEGSNIGFRKASFTRRVDVKEHYVGPEDEYKYCGERVTLRKILIGITCLVILAAFISVIQFFVDVVVIGYRSKFSSFLCMVLCTTAMVLFIRSVFHKPHLMRLRQLLKWGILGIMVANFLYGNRMVQNQIRPSGWIIFFAILNQFALTGAVVLCQQYELEMERASVVTKKKFEIDALRNE